LSLSEPDRAPEPAAVREAQLTADQIEVSSPPTMTAERRGAEEKRKIVESDERPNPGGDIGADQEDLEGADPSADIVPPIAEKIANNAAHSAGSRPSDLSLVQLVQTLLRFRSHDYRSSIAAPMVSAPRGAHWPDR
jgi:hypothetical protein